MTVHDRFDLPDVEVIITGGITDSVDVRFRLRPIHVLLTVDREALVASKNPLDLVTRTVEDGRKALYAAVHEHLEKHGRDDTERYGKRFYETAYRFSRIAYHEPRPENEAIRSRIERVLGEHEVKVTDALFADLLSVLIGGGAP